MPKNLNEHSARKSVILHLLPGILTGAVYYALVPAVIKHGYPSVMALSLAGILVLVPFELGYLFIQQKKSNQPFWGGIIRYLKPMKFSQYFISILVVLLASGLLFTAFKFTEAPLKHLFEWMKPAFMLDMGLNSEFSTSKLWITYGIFLVLIVVVLPVTEELYFRGFLLPRMPSGLNGWSPFLHSILFALYHTWTPWMFVARSFGVLPLILIVRRRENIFIGIIAHCLLNSIDFIMALIYLSGR